MKIIVFGANGKTGQEVVEQALRSGIEVTAFVRDAEKVATKSPHLQTMVGQATNYEDVKRAVLGHDAVISCVGGKGLKVSTTITDITTNIVKAMNEAGVKRVVQVGSAGVHGELKGVIGSIISFMLGNTLRDHKGAYEQLQKSGVDFTLARPVSLTNSPLKGLYRETELGIPARGMSISRADLAHFLLKAVQDEKYIGKSIGLAY